jgi:hypothetical protein
LSHFNIPSSYLPVLMLWIALAAIASILLREEGFRRVKKYPLTAIILVLSLASLPAGAVLKVARPYQRRVLALVKQTKSPNIADKGCPVFPANNVWNTPVQSLPVDAKSTAYIATMAGDDPLHPDFGTVGGIPFTVTDGRGAATQLTLGNGAANSEPGPYHIPDDAQVEQGSDSHVIVFNSGQCVLYELFGSSRLGPNRWFADSAAIFDLRANRTRPDGWTSADAAGTPILVGLARYEDVQAGRISHALRFTTRRTRRGYVWPATHYASASDDPHLPPMGQRFRLRAGFDLSGFSGAARVLLTALKEYGMILSDNGGNWYLSGTPDSRWPSSLPREFRNVHGSDFEAVDSASLMVRPDSTEARRQ